MNYNCELIKKFIVSIADLSYYEAAEGRQYFREVAEREKCRAEFRSLKADMVSKYGKQSTLVVMDSMSHLLYSETQDLK